MKKITLVGITIGLFLFFAIKAHAIDKTRIMNGDGVVSLTNPFPTTGSGLDDGLATETTLAEARDLLQDILDENLATETTLAAVETLLEKLKYTGNDLNVIFSNSTIGVTGTFYPVEQPVSLDDKAFYDSQLEQLKFTGNDLNVVFSNASIGVTATDLDIRDLTAVDIVTAEISEDTATETHAVLTLTVADTEYSYTLPATCIDYQAGESTNGISIKYSSYATGTGGDGCDIVPIGGYVEPRPMANTNYASKVLYFRDSINDGTKVVISYWIRN